MSLSKAIAILLCAARFEPVMAQAPCPESCNEYLSPYNPQTVCTSAAIYDPCEGVPYYCTRWNLQAGTWEMHIWDIQLGTARRILLKDDFTLVGPSSATPLPMTLRVNLGGQIFTCGMPHSGMNSHVTLRAGATQHEWQYYNGGCSELVLDETLDLPFTKLPNQPFRVEIEGYASVFGSEVRFEGNYEFILPPGYSIQSCQGFQSTPIGVEPASWTHVKRLYD